MPEGIPVAPKAISFGAGGHYRIARRLVPAATTLAGNLWAFRNPSALLAVIFRLRLRLLQVAAPTAAIEDQFSVVVQRGYTVGDTTGGVAISAAAAMQKARASMANSAVVIHEANVAAGLSGGNGTPDGNFHLSGSVWVPAAVQTTPVQGLTEVFSSDYDIGSGEHPIVLATSEGIKIRNENAFGAASGIVLYLSLTWAEVSDF